MIIACSSSTSRVLWFMTSTTRMSFPVGSAWPSVTMFFFLVIFILMSGLLTPIRSMPMWAQWLSMLDPMRHIIEALRLIYVKGSTFAELLPQFYTLLGFAVLTSTWAIVSYRKNS